MTTQGIHQMSAEAYHADPCPQPALSNSVAKILLSKSPAHAWAAHPKLNPAYRPDEDSRFDLGSAAHALLLEQDNAKICVVDAADWRTKAAKEQRDQARANGLLPILAKHDVAVKRMVQVALEYLEGSPIQGILGRGKPEQTVIWQDGEIWCKARPDWLCSDMTVVIDYKTTDTAEPSVFERQIAGLGYDVQAEFYSRGIHAVTGHRQTFIFLAQEITAPYACSLITLHPSWQEIAAAKVQRAIDLWGRCLSSNEWPAYPAGIHEALPPSWAMKQHETDILNTWGAIDA